MFTKSTTTTASAANPLSQPDMKIHWRVSGVYEGLAEQSVHLYVIVWLIIYKTFQF